MSTKPFTACRTIVAIDRRSVLKVILFAGLASSTGLSVAARAASSAAESIQRFGNSLVTLTQNGRASFTERFVQLAPGVDQAFDLETILRISVGPQWDTMSSAEQAELTRIFREYTIASFVANFEKPKGSFRIESVREMGSGEQVVDTTIGETKLGFVMRQSAGGWRAVDILGDGTISRVATQRSDFRSTLLRGGGPALLTSLRRKVADLSGGSLA